MTTEPKPTMTLSSGEEVKAPDYRVVSSDEILAANIVTLGTTLLPSDRRDYEFAKRSLGQTVIDPRDPRHSTPRYG